MRIKLGSVAYLRAANSGNGLGLDDEGHRVEFLGDRHGLALAAVGASAQDRVPDELRSRPHGQVQPVEDGQHTGRCC